MKRAAILFAAAALLLPAEYAREALSPQRADLRAFDGKAVGHLDTVMWRSYYERRQLLLFEQLITTIRTQFHLPPLLAAVNAYRAAHAAFVFKDGRSRADYERALPDLERYFAAISAQAREPFDARRAARLELEWWILHRERSTRLVESLAQVQSEIYHRPAHLFAEHARLRAEAMLLRDDKGEGIREQDWVRIGTLLERSWSSLAAAIRE